MNQLYILPFDHRSSFIKDILKVSIPNKDQKQEIRHLKQIILDGMIISLKNRKDKKNFAILVDEEYGQKVILDAKKNNIKICLPVEKSGEDILKFNYGTKFKEHITSNNPDFVKVLIRYNPDNKKNNQKQLLTLSELFTFCKEKKIKTILELLVPPTKENLADCNGEQHNYDKKLRADKTAQAIKEIKKVARPTIWKLEGFDSVSDWKKIITETKKTQIIVLGRGEDNKKVNKWLKEASQIKEIIGFAIGRTIFMNPIKQYHAKEISAEKAALMISKNFLSFVSFWEKNKKNENI